MELVYKELTHQIIGCAMEVHRELGPGFQEYVYQRALAIEFKKAELKFQVEFEIKIYYKGEYIALRRVDFWVEEKISIEIKAKSEIDNSNLAQTINYIEASKIGVGLLINFGAQSLQFKRVHNKHLFPYNQDESKKS